MAEYRIVCTNQEPCNVDKTKAHIVTVGTGDDPDQASKLWSLSQVIASMDKGDQFYTMGPTSKKRAEVEKYDCGSCKKTYIRSHKDATTDNNLDSLRDCRPAKQ